MFLLLLVLKSRITRAQIVVVSITSIVKNSPIGTSGVCSCGAIDETDADVDSETMEVDAESQDAKENTMKVRLVRNVWSTYIMTVQFPNASLRFRTFDRLIC
jgi:hypothetical protein